MTALDHAFIKAFSQQGAVTVAALPRSDRPAASEQPATAVVPEAAPAKPLATLDGVLAALEKPPKGASGLLTPKGGSPIFADHHGVMAPAKIETVPLKTESRHEDVHQNVLADEDNVPTDEGEKKPTTLLPAQQFQFQPAWQVDHFTWPRVCRRLMTRAGNELDRLVDALAAAGNQGQKVLAITGCRRGEGATTLLLCAARRLAERGLKLAMIDADPTRPRLAKRLGVQPQYGWDETTLEEEASLAQAIVEATGDNLSLLPMREPSNETDRPVGDPSRLARCLELLRNHYDMVLVDPGPLEDTALAGGSPVWAVPGAIDAVVLTYDQRLTTEAQLIQVERRMAVAGIATVGIVENFVVEC